jgi:hypothetical protein
MTEKMLGEAPKHPKTGNTMYRQSGLQYIPRENGKEGFYFYKTNPNAKGNWIISSSFKITRLVPMAEIESINKELGMPVPKWNGGYKPEDFGLSVEGVNEIASKTKKLMDPVTYDDKGDVIPLSERFDPKKEDIRYQKAGEQKSITKGSINITDDQYIIESIRGASDASTVIHELSHTFLYEIIKFSQMENAPQWLKDDMQRLLDWFGLESVDQIEVKHHEKFATGYESWVMEGNSPSKTLERPFSKFAKWLRVIYKKEFASSSYDSRVELNDDVRLAMQRTLATEEEINESAAINEIFSVSERHALALGLSGQDRDYLNKLYLEAREKATARLESERNKNLSKRIRQWKKDAADMYELSKISQTVNNLKNIPMSKRELVDLIGKKSASEILAKFPGIAAKTSDKSITDIAVETGYASAGIMLNDLVQFPNKKAFIASYVKEVAQMKEQVKESKVLAEKEYHNSKAGMAMGS